MVTQLLAMFCPPNAEAVHIQSNKISKHILRELFLLLKMLPKLLSFSRALTTALTNNAYPSDDLTLCCLKYYKVHPKYMIFTNFAKNCDI